MSLYSGVTGKVSMKNGATAAVNIVHLSNWTVDITKTINDVVSFGDTYKEKIPGIKDWTASCDGKADFDTTGGQKMLLDAFESGSKLTGSFYLDTNTFFSGDCFVKSLKFKDAADGSVDVTIELEGSGGNTLTLPSA